MDPERRVVQPVLTMGIADSYVLSLFTELSEIVAPLLPCFPETSKYLAIIQSSPLYHSREVRLCTLA